MSELLTSSQPSLQGMMFYRTSQLFSLGMLIALLGCGAFDSSKVDRSNTQIPVESCELAGTDITAVDSHAEVASGQTVSFRLQGKAKDFPADFRGGSVKLVKFVNGKPFQVQGASFKVMVSGDQLEISVDLKIPPAECSSTLQVLHNGVVLLDRLVTIVEAK